MSEDRYYEVPRTVDDVALLGELDVWYWSAEWQTPGEDSIEFGPYDFSLSPHNSDFTTDVEGNLWVHQRHYSGGVRFLTVERGSDHGLVSPGDRFECNRASNSAGDCAGHDYTGADGPHNDTDWSLTEEGWGRPNLEPPTDSRMEGLNYLTPFCWGANESNGVTFAADINQGIYALQADAIDLGGAPAVVDLTRSDDGSVFMAGQTNRIDHEIETDEPVRVRDRLPAGWEVVGGDAVTTYDTGDGLRVEFDEPVGPTGAGPTTRSMFVTVGGTANQQVGPVQFATDDDPSRGGKDWETLADSVGPVLVGPSQ